MALVTDWISLDEGKEALNVTGSLFDAEIALYISAVSQRLDQLAGAAVIRTVTNEAHDVASPTSMIQLAYRPVATITSVTEYTGTTSQALAAESNATKTAYDYLIDAEYGWLMRRASGSDAFFPTGRGNVVITYTAGRYAATTNVAARLKLAANIFLSHLWRREQGAGTQTFGPTAFEPIGIPSFGVPNVVRDLLLNEIAPVIA